MSWRNDGASYSDASIRGNVKRTMVAAEVNGLICLWPSALSGGVLSAGGVTARGGVWRVA